ncbi:transporter substrate-binding domain-containing protein [Legionella micdadei]|uniref:transporter substrate-binding domain-containing protein n=1 Tax=Legionella micdadei TaxID=451 RepID=UPI0009EF7D1A|nr:transporter substrate-binding domain-containing protein [Legionella micdadei]ARH00266.1 hypothetical protein B6V88_07440 [Legionella micdadei]
MKLILRLLILLLCIFFNASPLYANIRVGTLLFYPPFANSGGGGFDNDLIQKICQRLHETCILVPMDSNQLYPALDNGKIDIAIGLISISSNESSKYTYSLPYLVSKGQFLVSNGNIKSIQDLKGKKVGVIRGKEDNADTFYNYLITNFNGLFEIVQFDDIEDLITSLNGGDIAGAYIHKSAASYWARNSNGELVALDPANTLGEGLAMIALPANAPLIQRINQQLQQMEKDSTFLNLYNTYFGQL